MPVALLLSMWDRVALLDRATQEDEVARLNELLKSARLQQFPAT